MYRYLQNSTHFFNSSPISIQLPPLFEVHYCRERYRALHATEKTFRLQEVSSMSPNKLRRLCFSPESPNPTTKKNRQCIALTFTILFAAAAFAQQTIQT